MKERVVVAMSGGVDSSVAAALLKQQGYEVIGITMCFNLPDSTTKRPSCCGIQGIEDAKRVAHKLGVKHYVLNFNKVLKEKIIKDFCREYLKGRTPNPCVRCNQYLKFDALLKKALSLDAKYLATGHYARIEKIPNSNALTPLTIGTERSRSAKSLPVRQAGQIPKYLLKKAKDLHKDQSYFLYRLGQKQLKHILFPLGDYTKEEVRKMAREFALPVADKLASQEICFLPGVDYRSFLKAQISATGGKTDINPGPVIDKEGKILGTHKGIAFYTVGQREGLGIARSYPLYVIKINPKDNCITAGKREDVYAKEFLLRDTHFIFRPLKKRVALKVRIRYNHAEAAAKVIFFRHKLRVIFNKPQFAVTPGQSAVFYAQDTVFGGGIIDKVLR